MYFSFLGTSSDTLVMYWKLTCNDCWKRCTYHTYLATIFYYEYLHLRRNWPTHFLITDYIWLKSNHTWRIDSRSSPQPDWNSDTLYNWQLKNSKLEPLKQRPRFFNLQPCWMPLFMACSSNPPPYPSRGRLLLKKNRKIYDLLYLGWKALIKRSRIQYHSGINNLQRKKFDLSKFSCIK